MCKINLRYKRNSFQIKKGDGLFYGSFCTLGICIFSEFAISHKIGLIEQNENSIVTQTSERTEIQQI